MAQKKEIDWKDAFDVVDNFSHIIVDNGTQKGKKITKDQVKAILAIEGAQLESLQGGTTVEPTLLVAPGTLEYRWSKASPGEYKFGSEPNMVATTGSEWIIEWIGGVPSLKDMGELPIAPPTPVNGVVAIGNKNAVPGEEVYNKTALKSHGKNYVDYTALKDEFYVNDETGELSPNSSYKATEKFIEIKPSTAYMLDKVVRLAYYSAPNVESFISGIFQEINTPTEKTSPAGAKYIRLSGSSSFSEMYLGLASEYTGFVPYEKVLEPDVKAQAITNELKDEILGGTAKLVKSTGKNRINPQTFTPEHFVNAITGVLDFNKNYKASDFIYVGDLVDYTISPLIRHIAKYSEANEASFISGVENPSSNTVIRDGENYVRLSFLNTDYWLQLESGNVVTSFEPYRDAVLLENKDNIQIELPTGIKKENELLVPAVGTVYVLPSLPYFLYFKNAFISDYGFEDIKIFDAHCNSGRFMSKKFKLMLNSGDIDELFLRGYQYGNQLVNKRILIRTANITSGDGITRKVLFLGDSTIYHAVIVDHFKEYFDANGMKVEMLGVRQTPSGTKHEGRSGAKIKEYFQEPTAAGISNPFLNPGSSRFDFTYYLGATGQTMGANDWFMFQLGINDLYPIADSRNITQARNLVKEMIEQLNYIIDSVKTVNADIRIGISMTIPPAAEQDATAILLSSGGIQNKSAYEKMGLKTWWSELLREFESRVSEKIYLVPSNLFLDTENNFQTSDLPIDNYNTNLVKTQIDDVHPSTAGYKQMSDLYIGIVKYFG
ncbi:SGNH/GDSL hydrolase family protein [Sphingobacterium lactis]|uniref:SGNH/GDSL hydrolase family protein n=1 Tax=Sphingobacterium lactis TaxID=797291 RepID=UPI003F81908A